MWEDPGQDTRRRQSVTEAADALGVTVDAVRSRIKRGTIAHERKGGRVYVLLGADESRPGHDQASDQGARESEDRTAELIATLREQLQTERQAHAEARRIIAGLVERIPALEAPEGRSGSPVRDQGEGDRGNVPAEYEPEDEPVGRDLILKRLQRSLALSLFGTFAGLLGVSISAEIASSGESVRAIIASVRDAFSTAITSGASALSGDQWVTIVSAIITVIGTISATYLGIRWSRRGRDQRRPV
jgi:hypothetical protein